MVAGTTTNHPPRQIPKFLNQILSFILRSPLHRMMSSQIMLISFRGRKTGKRYTTPVGYMRDGQQLTLFTDHQWWKNLSNNAQVSVLVQGKTLQGTSEVSLDKSVTTEELRRYLERLPNAARAFSVEKNAAGKFDQEEIHKAAQRFTMIRINVNQTLV